jgi:hypothetical protein
MKFVWNKHEPTLTAANIVTNLIASVVHHSSCLAQGAIQDRAGV